MTAGKTVCVLLSGSKHLPSVLETIQITRNRRQNSAMDRKKNKQHREQKHPSWPSFGRLVKRLSAVFSAARADVIETSIQ